MKIRKCDKKSILKYVILFIIFTCLFYIILYPLYTNGIYYMVNVIIMAILLSLNLTGLFIAIVDYFNEKIRYNKKESVNIENIEYYRDFFDDVSPLIVSKLVNKKKDFNDDIIVLMLYLENKKIISINEEKIEVINDKEGLLEHEKYFIENHEKIFFNLRNKQLKPYKFYRLLKKDMKSLKYIKAYKESFLSKFSELFILLAIIIGLINICAFHYLALSWIVYVISFAIVIFKKTALSFEEGKVYGGLRTEKGMELTNKSLALKRFIEDFSSLNDKKIEEIKMWDSYLIYVLVFDIPGLLDKEANKLYKLIMDNYVDEKIESNRKLFRIVFPFMFITPLLVLLFVMLDLPFLYDKVMPLVMSCGFLIFIIMIYKKSK